MRKRIIQVPVEEGLLKQLDDVSRKQHRARAGLIREACAHYLKELDSRELDQMYRRGYKRKPEASAVAEAQTAMSGEVLSKESW